MNFKLELINLKNFLLVLLLLTSNVVESQNLSNNQKVNQIIENSRLENYLELLFEFVKKSFPTITESAWKEMLGTNKEFLEDARSAIIDEYLEQLTIDEINFLYEFYNSKTGNKFKNLTDSIIYNLDFVSGDWADTKLNEFIRKVEEDHGDLLSKGACEKMIEGKYYYLDPFTKDTVIVERTSNEQIEYLPKGTCEYEISWENDCTYTLKCTKYIDETYEHMIGIRTYVKLIEVDNEKVKFIAMNNEGTYIHIDNLYFKR